MLSRCWCNASQHMTQNYWLWAFQMSCWNDDVASISRQTDPEISMILFVWMGLRTRAGQYMKRLAAFWGMRFSLVPSFHYHRDHTHANTLTQLAIFLFDYIKGLLFSVAVRQFIPTCSTISIACLLMHIQMQSNSDQLWRRATDPYGSVHSNWNFLLSILFLSLSIYYYRKWLPFVHNFRCVV